MTNNDTIIALATAAGSSAIAIIRLSGNESISLVDSVFKSAKFQKKLSKQKSHTVHLGVIADKNTAIDQVLVSVFKNPHSYTGEDVVEISCHGSHYIQQSIIDLLIEKGARLAKAGEFTLRAFLNKKMDLSQAEAVADLIAAESKAEHQIAIGQMRGGFSEQLKKLREQLINFAALIELELDFSEEDVAFANRKELLSLVIKIKEIIKKLIDSFAYGNVIKNGVPVVIAGKPNAGKSSLLNTLFNEEKAIVSKIAGTTRDSIEDILVIDGIPFRFTDTAGLRKANDKIEAIGVSRAKNKIEAAKIVIYLYDFSDEFDQEFVDKIYKENKIIILAMNKIDQLDGIDNNWIKYLKTRYPKVKNCAISAKKGINIDVLKQLLTNIISKKQTAGLVVSNSRHKNALENTLTSLQAVQKGLDANLSGDLLAIDIRESLRYIGQITGEVAIDKDILGTIFGKFCIGK